MACCFKKTMNLFIFLASLLVLAAVPAWADDVSKNEAEQSGSPYELGNGLKLGDSGFTLGGYGSIEYSGLRSTQDTLAISHASLFVWWQSQSLPLQFFSEIDSQYQFANKLPDQGGGDRAISLERMYFDYSFNDEMTIRAGKYLTPFGRWNLIHADPLVWTTSRPQLTENLFAENVSGVMAHGNVAWFGSQSVDYNLFGSAGGDLHQTRAQDDFKQALGGHLNTFVSPYTQLGLSYIGFTLPNDIGNHFQLFGVDLLWKRNDHEIMAEYATRLSSKSGDRKATGAYLQGVLPLWNKIYGVVRLETMHDPAASISSNQCIIGLNFRQSRAVSYKIEYQQNIKHSDVRPQGILSSISLLF